MQAKLPLLCGQTVSRCLGVSHFNLPVLSVHSVAQPVLLEFSDLGVASGRCTKSDLVLCIESDGVYMHFDHIKVKQAQREWVESITNYVFRYLNSSVCTTRLTTRL